jgi:hypothetical protein
MAQNLSKSKMSYPKNISFLTLKVLLKFLAKFVTNFGPFCLNENEQMKPRDLLLIRPF